MPIPGVYRKVAEGQQSLRKTGTIENPKKFEGQDFNRIRDLCISRKQLFEDDKFPANLNSIGHDLLSQDKRLNIKWKRPIELQRDTRFLVDGASRFDIMQGDIGDCWVLSAVGALTLHQKFQENVIPKDQEFTYKYAGIFHFRFWQYGEWVDVVVDDRLPMLHGKYLSVQPRVSNEFWPSLLEKAYAKLRGSYQNLHWGFVTEALVDFTGGVPLNINLREPPSDLRDIVSAAARSGCVMGCTTPGNVHTGNTELQNGLIKGHAYTLTDYTQIEYNNKVEELVRVWNPWGKGEWNGRWSDKSPQWGRVRPEIKHKLNVDRNDGEFWMSCQDFVQNFALLYICNPMPSYLDSGRQFNVWETTSYYGQWVRGSSAGGCNPADDMWKNPQYVITVPESQGTKRGYNVTVALMQSMSNERKCNPRWLHIGFAFCKVAAKVVQNGSQQKYSQQHITQIINSNLEQSREVTRSFRASPGTYVIVPFTYNKGQESEFLLRIFTKTSQIAKSPDTVTTPTEINRKLSTSSTSSQSENSRKVEGNGNQMMYFGDATLSGFGPRLSITAHNTKDILKRYQDGNYENIFGCYANQNSEMHAEQLQMLLNDVVTADEAFVANREEFGLDSCRGILMLMDLNANGRLSLSEFSRLWKRLNMCKDLFRTIDVNRSGYLDGFGLAKAIKKAGLLVSDTVLNIMVLRYGNCAQKLSFADFVCCMIRLETVTKVFRSLKNGAGVYLSGEEWMQIIMST